MSFRTKHWVLGASILAASALIAGCGGSDEMEPDPPAPMADPTNGIALPLDHGIPNDVDKSFNLTAGMSHKAAGVRFWCDADAGVAGCTVTLAPGDDGVTATFDGGAVAAVALDKKGYTSFTNLSGALLDKDERPILMANLYEDGGVTSSLTTHEEPFNADPDSGVSDIFVSVTPAVQRVDDSHAMKEGIMDPVLVDEDGMVISDRSTNFEVGADWDRNPAAEWMASLKEATPADPLIDDMWTYSVNSKVNGMGLPGGRTLHLDLRSDYTPNMTMKSPDYKLIARGPASVLGGLAKISVNWDDIMLEGIDVPLGGEIDLGEGIPGSYKDIQGMFTCAEGGVDDEQNICRINHHTNGEMNVSEDDMVKFTPNVYTLDTNWLAAGVWLTIPDDEDQGDYAIGAFVYGNNPYEADSEANAQEITGKATYTGQAFGRFAESDGGNKETGRFTANAELMANFDNAAIGTIYGDVTEFMANGEAQNWDVNFEQAMIMMPTGGGALRSNAGISGHGGSTGPDRSGGHALTGYWNSQFYGDSTNAAGGIIQPGSVAGTFGATTERDPDDAYSLILGGAFAAHQ